ncbi:MAG TPA: hypothetical protein VMA34_01425 [Terracidiphilus sp.]|nr:hypothetical protein [Terracidiphilus sp.]
MLRPSRPALVALAVLVFLWGLNYKLSLYHHCSKPVSRTTVAKLWIEPRAPQLVLASASGHAQHSLSGAHALSAAPGPFPRLLAVAAKHSGVVLHCGGDGASLIPPRSPPPSLTV